jgi:hypothetical protein
MGVDSIAETERAKSVVAVRRSDKAEAIISFDSLRFLALSDGVESFFPPSVSDFVCDFVESVKRDALGFPIRFLTFSF